MTLTINVNFDVMLVAAGMKKKFTYQYIRVLRNQKSTAKSMTHTRNTAYILSQQQI